jgi:hypothetical protein
VSHPALRPFKDTSIPSEEETMTAETTTLIRELDRRISDGIEVRLLWRPQDEVVLVAVSDARTEESFAIEVREGEKPLDVFHHPYAYAAWHGIETNAEPRRRLEVRGGLADPV